METHAPIARETFADHTLVFDLPKFSQLPSVGGSNLILSCLCSLSLLTPDGVGANGVAVLARELTSPLKAIFF